MDSSSLSSQTVASASCPGAKCPRKLGAFPIFIISQKVLETNWVAQFEESSKVADVSWALICTDKGSEALPLVHGDNFPRVGGYENAFVNKDADFAWDFFRKYLQPTRGHYSQEAFGVVDASCVEGEEFECLVCCKVIGTEDLMKQRIPVKPAAPLTLRFFETKPEYAMSQAPQWQQELSDPHTIFCPEDQECGLRQGYLPIFIITDEISDSYYSQLDEAAKQRSLAYRILRNAELDAPLRLLHESDDKFLGDDKNAFLEWTMDEVYDFFRDAARPSGTSWQRGHFTSFTFGIVDDVSARENKIYVLTNAPDPHDPMEEGPSRSRLKWTQVPIAEAITAFEQLENLSTTYTEFEAGRTEPSIVPFPPPGLRAPEGAKQLNVWGQMPASEARFNKFNAIYDAIIEGKFKQYGFELLPPEEAEGGADEQDGEQSQGAENGAE